MKTGTRVGAFALSCLLFAGVLALAPSPASAHDELVSSNPANGSTVATMPTSVSLAFEEPPAAGYTKVTVHAASGADVSSGPVVSNGSHISRGVRSGLGPGTYTVKYSLLSDDGHPVSGALSFIVAAKVTSAAPAVAPQSNGGGDSRWMWYLAGGLVALGLLYAAVRVFSPAPSTRVRG